MRPNLERIEPSKGLSFAAFHRFSQGCPFEWHHHPESELTLIEEGSGRRFIGDHVAEYADGDLVLIGPWLPHTWSTDGPTPQRASWVQFAESWMLPIAGAAAEFAPVARLLARSRRGLFFQSPPREVVKLLPTIARQPKTAADAAGRSIVLLRILNELAHAARVVPLASAAYAADPPPADPRISRAMRYAADHFTDKISQSHAAQLAHLTPEAFSRLFHRHTGRTFQRHVHDLRVGRACRLLQDLDRSITEICFAAGFGNVANFNRVFLRLKGLTPRDFRRKFTQPAPAAGIPYRNRKIA
ncbi:MAG: helix-turn-helix domain-containing protein [Tepidisphaeraceae bacterium]